MKFTRFLPHYLTVLCLACAGLALPAHGQQQQQQQQPAANANPRVTFSLLFAGADQKPYTVTVPRNAEGSLTVSIPVGNGTTWLVSMSVNWTAHEVYVSAIDPKLSPTLSVFSSYYDVAFDKPISLVKTPAYAMELTMTTE